MGGFPRIPLSVGVSAAMHERSCYHVQTYSQQAVQPERRALLNETKAWTQLVSNAQSTVNTRASPLATSHDIIDFVALTNVGSHIVTVVNAEERFRKCFMLLREF
ncbi:hypothetical protein AVEN_65974-1 [Araneus ventricosus]|uniref:Uncharacterized protein n=1 Tax=Araneus ventricosus TaxID=182803 RepID=A0A4Y2G3E1_ARAVE|nr:hypothetical protein AVEN_65974-1 [Araneus ventricosus]